MSARLVAASSVSSPSAVVAEPYTTGVSKVGISISKTALLSAAMLEAHVPMGLLFAFCVGSVSLFASCERKRLLAGVACRRTS